MNAINRSAVVARRTAVCALAAVALSVVAPQASLAKGKATSLEGVWKITNVTTTGANAATIASPQPSLIIFSRGHYSYVAVGGPEPRASAAPAKNPDKLTDAEKIAKYDEWDKFTGQAGTYEVKKSTLVRQPIAAKNVSVMTTDGPIEQEYKLAGNSLVLISKSAAGQPAREQRTTLTRVR